MKKYNIRNRIFLGISLLILLCCLTGCGEKESISLDEISDGTQAMQDGEKQEAAGANAKDSEEKAQEAVAGNESKAASVPEMLSVYVCGAVNTPGVYELPAGSRLYQAIDAAGGMREDADRNYLNLAMELMDGQKLQVPTQEEVRTGAVDAETSGNMSGNASESSTSGSGEASSGGNGLVNINTADETLLMTLPGIGETKAKSIIAYRQENGAFSKIEDIMNIPGIKQAVYEKIKTAICVN